MMEPQVLPAALTQPSSVSLSEVANNTTSLSHCAPLDLNTFRIDGEEEMLLSTNGGVNRSDNNNNLTQARDEDSGAGEDDSETGEHESRMSEDYNYIFKDTTNITQSDRKTEDDHASAVAGQEGIDDDVVDDGVVNDEEDGDDVPMTTSETDSYHRLDEERVKLTPTAYSPAGQLIQSVPHTPETVIKGEQVTEKSSPIRQTGQRGQTGGSGTKSSTKKSFVWKYFHHPLMLSGHMDRSRTQCILCDSQLAFNASGTTTTMLNHLKSRHGDIAEREELQRRHYSRSSRGSQQQTANNNNSTCASDGTDLTEQNGGGQTGRSPATQRGRPPGSGKRQKGSKTLGDTLELPGPHLSATMKSEMNSSLFGFGAGLTEQQHRALLLLSSEGFSQSMDPSRLGNGDVQSSLLSSAAMMGQTGPSNGAADLPPKMLANSWFNQSSLLNAVSALSNGSFNLTLPGGQLNGGLTGGGSLSHELSPSSSSGLGVSVSSPMETPTNMASPTSSNEIRNINSPLPNPHNNHGNNANSAITTSSGIGSSATNLIQWSSHMSHATGKPMRNRDSGKSVPSVHNNNNNYSPMNFTGAPTQHPTDSMGLPLLLNGSHVSSQSGQQSMSEECALDMQSKLKPFSMFNRDCVAPMGLMQGLQTPGHPQCLTTGHMVNTTSPSSNPTDLATTFAPFLNFPPVSMTNGTHYPTIDPINSLGSIPSSNSPSSVVSSGQMDSSALQQQQQWLQANPWFTSLISGKLLNNPGSLIDPTTMLQILANTPSCTLPSATKYNSTDETGKMTNSSLSMPNLVDSMLHQKQQQQQQHCNKSLTDCLTTSWASSLSHSAPGNNNMNISCLLGSNPSSLQTSTCQRSLPTTMQQLAAVQRSLSLHTDPDQDTYNNNNNNTFSRGGFGYNNASPEPSLVDLSKTTPTQRNVGGGGATGLVGESSLVSESTMPCVTTASTKRKRARPVYISPECDSQKRRLVQSGSLEAASLVSESNKLSTLNPVSLVNGGCGGIAETHAATSVGWKRSNFLHHLVGYLIRDLQPPEMIEGEGFRTLLLVLSSQAAPTMTELRRQILPGLTNTVRAHLQTRLDRVFRASGDSSSSVLENAMALAVELWPPARQDRQANEKEIDQSGCYHANVQIHCTSGSQKPHLQSYMHDSVPIRTTNSLQTCLQDCTQYLRRSSANTITCDSNSLSQPTRPCPLVCNDIERLDQWLKTEKSANTTEYLVIPCFVTELVRAVTTGLSNAAVQKVLNQCKQHDIQSVADSQHEIPQTPVSKREEQSLPATMDEQPTEIQLSSSPQLPSISPSTPSNNNTQTWAQAFHVLTTSKETRRQTEKISSNDCQSSDQLLSLLEAMNQTLELVHRGDLVLTASMIEPILYNLRKTHLSPVIDNESSGKREEDAIEAFKVTVVKHLDRVYPLTGLVRETLQLSSLLDPRFKEHVQERQPVAVKLLKLKMDAIQLDSPITPAGLEASTTGPRSAKSTVDKAGLQTVFGLQRASLSEVDRYLREDPIGFDEDPLAWWATKATNFPRVAQLAAYYLTIPLTCFANGRLQSLQQASTTTTITTIPSFDAEPNTKHLRTSAALSSDGLDIPTITDPLGRDRSRLVEEDQAVYNFLWHNWDLVH